MRRSFRKIVEEFKLFWKYYVFQSMLATAVVFIVLLLLSIKHAVIIASIGATAFIVFAMPKMITAQTRNVIGGHTIGLILGSLCALIPHYTIVLTALAYSSAVGISIFLMVVLDAEHPPAAGTALGFAITGFSVNAALALAISVIILCIAHHLFKSYLRDLT